MYHSSPALTATLQALRGQSDMHVIAPAFSNRQFARVLPFAPDVHPVVGALGALAGALPNGVPQHVLESPELSAAVASSIGTSAGDRILPTWAKIAPAGWGEPYASALIDIANRGRCPSWVAAALIGPTNDAAALLRLARDIAVAIRRWGEATPNDPTAWMNTLSPEQQNRLLNALRHTPVAAASCLPWLPPEYAREVAGLVAQNDSALALGAYASASPIARDRHADILSALIHRTDMYDLGDLTHLAVATGMDAAWTTIGQILSESPGSAIHVVVMAPWDALREDVQTTILSAADNDPTSICAAIAFARGVSSDPPPIGEKTAVAFFSTVTPEVWNELPKDSESFCPHLTQIFEFPRIWTHQDRTNSKYALPATVSDAMRLAALNRGHWQVEKWSPWVKDGTPDEDACQTHIGYGVDGNGIAMVRIVANRLIQRAGCRMIAARLRCNRRHSHNALALPGCTVAKNTEALNGEERSLAKPVGLWYACLKRGCCKEFAMDYDDLPDDAPGGDDPDRGPYAD